MSAIRIDGKEIAKNWKNECKEYIRNTTWVTPPYLVVVMVGDNPASKVYVRNKTTACEETGIRTHTILLSEDSSTEDVIQVITNLNHDKEVTGILVQLPLPDHINEKEVIENIDPQKDVDGLTEINQATHRYIPCTPRGVMKIIEQYDSHIPGKNAVIIGRSFLVGRPMAKLLLDKDFTVTVCHSKTQNLAEYVKNADLLVVAVGKPGLVTKDMVKPGAFVIDVGINRVNGKLVGDVASDVEDVAGYITPVPGGVGPMTVAALISNSILASERLN